MKSKFIPALTAIALALVVGATNSFATTYTPASYKKGLVAALGKKTGNAAISSAAQFLKLALSDPKNKKQVKTFTSTTITTLKKPVPKTLQAQSAAKLADAVTNGYFKVGTFNPEDRNFAAALTSVGKSVTDKKFKTTATAMNIAKPVLAFNRKKGNDIDFLNFINDTVYKSLGLTAPPHVS